MQRATIEQERIAAMATARTGLEAACRYVAMADNPSRLLRELLAADLWLVLSCVDSGCIDRDRSVARSAREAAQGFANLLIALDRSFAFLSGVERAPGMSVRLADQAFASAAESEPANTFAHVGRGIVQGLLGEAALAVAHCRIGVSLAPRNLWWARTQLATSLYEAGLFTEARQEAAEACGLPGAQSGAAERIAAAAREAERLGLAEVIGALRGLLEEAGIRHRLQAPVRAPGAWGWKAEDDAERPPLITVITESLGDCYGAVGAVHAAWQPLPGGFQDHIAMPGADLHQSLHSELRLPGGRTVRLQIRTQDMHCAAALGRASLGGPAEPVKPNETVVAGIQ